MMKLLHYIDNLALYTWYCSLNIENIQAVMPAFDYKKPVHLGDLADPGKVWVEQNGIKAIVPTDTIYPVISNAAE